MLDHLNFIHVGVLDEIKPAQAILFQTAFATTDQWRGRILQNL